MTDDELSARQIEAETRSPRKQEVRRRRQTGARRTSFPTNVTRTHTLSSPLSRRLFSFRRFDPRSPLFYFFFFHSHVRRRFEEKKKKKKMLWTPRPRGGRVVFPSSTLGRYAALSVSLISRDVGCAPLRMDPWPIIKPPPRVNSHTRSTRAAVWVGHKAEKKF